MLIFVEKCCMSFQVDIIRSLVFTLNLDIKLEWTRREGIDVHVSTFMAGHDFDLILQKLQKHP